MGEVYRSICTGVYKGGDRDMAILKRSGDDFGRSWMEPSTRRNRAYRRRGSALRREKGLDMAGGGDQNRGKIDDSGVAEMVKLAGGDDCWPILTNEDADAGDENKQSWADGVEVNLTGEDGGREKE
ncbi:hypothetical protein HHK36_012106 [Tetracentron sinense]|uniref:Uncharacterized protein n=1 Tax=Tetracentron sinense TaxID=13715 RepID=A0A835DHW6_TETSI|nr:hypothetical protein HHK36_012106 [Tetracentron sinense]